MSAQTHKSHLGLTLLVVAVLIVAAGIYAFWALRPVALVEPVAGGTAVEAEPGSVTVAADYFQELRTDVPGRLIKKDFKLDPGERVKEGQILAQLDPTDLKLEIEKDQIDDDAAKERYKTDRSAELALESLDADLANFRRLNKLGNYPDSDLAKRDREVKIQEQKVELEKIDQRQNLATFENTLAVEHHKLEQMTLRAPFDAVVSVVTKHPGDMVGPGESIATLITTHMVVEGRISEEDFAHVKLGQRATVTFLPYGSWDFDATVIKILPTADPETQRHRVHLDVKVDADHPLIPGINGEMSIVVGDRQARTIVPRRALFSLNGDNVYVVKDGRVEMRKVKTGYLWVRGAEILQGLEPGDRVIVEELENFHPGDRVRVQEIPADVVASN